MTDFRRRIFKDASLYAAANYFAIAVGIVVSIVTKAVLGAAGAGYWALLKVFSSYAEYADLGTRDALSREIPQARGAGDQTRCRALEDTAFSFTLGMAFVAAAVLAAAGFFVQDRTLRAGLWAISALTVATHLYNYFLTLLRASKKVPRLSALIVVNILLTASFPLLGAWRYGVVGMALGFVASTGVAAFLGYVFSGAAVRLAWNRKEAGRLLRIGLPMIFLSYLLVTFLSIDAIAIGRWLGVEALGFYTIALMSVQQISALGRFFYIVLFPHVQERYGQGGDLRALGPLFVKATKSLIFLIPVVIAAVYFGVPVVVNYFLPKFAAGVPAMKVLVAGYYFIAVSELAFSVFFTTNHQERLIPVYAALTAFAFAANYVAVRSGHGILGVAVAMSTAYFFYFLWMTVAAFLRLVRGSEVAALVLSAVGVFASFAVILGTADALWPGGTLGVSLLKFAVFLAAFSPFLWYYNRKENLIGMALQAFLPKTRIAHG